MDIKQALENVAKLHQERDLYQKKSVKAKIGALISLIVGVPCLVTFIVMIVMVSKDFTFKTGLVLSIVFGVFALIFLELAIILYTINKCIYLRKVENYTKLLAYIEKEVNGNKKQ